MSKSSWPLLSPKLARAVQIVANGLMPHRYTRTSRSEDDAHPDAWNQATISYGTPATGLPCLWEPGGQPRTGPEGLIVVDRPQLVVPLSDPVAVGDTVSHITTLDGTVLDPGPLEVTMKDSWAAGSGWVLTLQGGEAG